MMKTGIGVVISDNTVFPEDSPLSSEFLAEGADMFVSVEKFRFRNSWARALRLVRAVLPESSCWSRGLWVVREARIISCSDGDNCRKNSLSSGDKKARGSSLVTDGPGGTVVVLVETGSVTTEGKRMKTLEIIPSQHNLTWTLS